MGYFSNGTEGDIYRDRYCENCVHWKDLGDGRGPGCPIYDLHFLYNYDQCKSGEPGETIAAMLGALIPRAESGLFNEQCTMFHGKHWREDEPTLPLEVVK